MAKGKTKQEIEKPTADDIIKYLKLLYFGDTNKPYEAAINRAYRDFCRTIQFNGEQQDRNKNEAKKDITSFIKSEIIKAANGTSNQGEFDIWHEKTCAKIREKFKIATLHDGQAQKWLNMTLKYLLIMDIPEAKQLIRFLHIPIDNSVIKIAREEKNVEAKNLPWSKWDYGTYLEYQKKLRGEIGVDTIPIIWEITHWKPKVLLKEQ